MRGRGGGVVPRPPLSHRLKGSRGLLLAADEHLLWRAAACGPLRGHTTAFQGEGSRGNGEGGSVSRGRGGGGPSFAGCQLLYSDVCSQITWRQAFMRVR